MLHVGWSEISALVSGMSGLVPLVLESTMSDRCNPALEDLIFATEKETLASTFCLLKASAFFPRSVGPHRRFLWDPCNSCVNNRGFRSFHTDQGSLAKSTVHSGELKQRRIYYRALRDSQDPQWD